MLGDVLARVGLDALAELGALGAGGLRAHEHAHAARLVDGLDHQLVEVVHHVGAVVLPRADEGGHLLQDGLLAEVEADHLRHEGVHRLVVGDAVARRVGERHVARGVRADEAGHAERAVRPEDLRIEEGVVGAPVDDVDPARPARGADEHAVVVDEEIGRLHQLDPHGPREEAVLEVGRVVGPRGEHHHARALVRAGRRDGAQRLGEAGGVVIDAPDPRQIEDLGEDALGDEPVLHHVGDAGGRAQVVLQHAEDALVVADEVDAGDVDAHAARRPHAAEDGQVELGPEDQVAQDGPPREDALLAVDVVEEEPERAQPLRQPALQVRERGRRDHARDEAEGEDLLGAAVVGVDRERHPLVEERQLGQRLRAREGLRRERRQQLERAAELGARLGPGIVGVGPDQLVERAWEEGVVSEEARVRRLARDDEHDSAR